MTDPLGVKDVWLNPLDSQRSARERRGATAALVVSVAAGLCGIATLIVGAVALAGGATRPRWVLAYVICSMCLELSVWLMTALSAAAVYLTFGRNALIHSLSVLSLSSDAMLSLAYLSLSVWGFATLFWLYETDAFPFLQYGEPPGGWPLQFYLIVSWLAATGYTASKLPTLVGAISFMLSRIKNKLERTPIVQFYTQYGRGDEYYIRVMPLEECSELIEAMPNPLH